MGQVEKNIRDARHHPRQLVPQAESLDEQTRGCSAMPPARKQPRPDYYRCLANAAGCLTVAEKPFDNFLNIANGYNRSAPSTSIAIATAFANRPVSLRLYLDRFQVVVDALCHDDEHVGMTFAQKMAAMIVGSPNHIDTLTLADRANLCQTREEEIRIIPDQQSA